MSKLARAAAAPAPTQAAPAEATPAPAAAVSSAAAPVSAVDRAEQMSMIKTAVQEAMTEVVAHGSICIEFDLSL